MCVSLLFSPLLSSPLLSSSLLSSSLLFSSLLFSSLLCSFSLTALSHSSLPSPHPLPSPPSLPSQGGTRRLPLLAAEDLQAFLNRVYLEDALPAAPGPTSLALQHVAWSCGEREALKLLDFVVEKASEHVCAPGGASVGYRPYFRLVSELLLSNAVDTALAFDAALPTLLARAEALVARGCCAAFDAEVVYGVFKLLHRVGTASAEGHLCVMRCKSQWAGLRRVFAAASAGVAGRAGAGFGPGGVGAGVGVGAGAGGLAKGGVAVAAVAATSRDQQQFGYSMS